MTNGLLVFQTDLSTSTMQHISTCAHLILKALNFHSVYHTLLLFCNEKIAVFVDYFITTRVFP